MPEGKEFTIVSNSREIVIDGNTTTITRSSGWWEKTVVDGNTTTYTHSGGYWTKTVVDGNATIFTSSSAEASPQMTVVDRQGYNIYIFTTIVSDSIRSGKAYSAQKNYDQAIADFTQAIRIDPNSEDAYYERGRAYRAKGDNDRAIMDFSQAIRLDPNDAYNYADRGYTYHQMKDYRNAIPDYEASLRINPNLTSTENNLESARKQVR